MPLSIRHILSSYMPIKYKSHINYALAVLNALQQVYQPFTPVLKTGAGKTGIVYMAYIMKIDVVIISITKNNIQNGFSLQQYFEVLIIVQLSFSLESSLPHM